MWGRANHPRNSQRASALRQAAFDALVDSWQPGLSGERIQCVDGRISRLLGSLATLDFDEKNWDMRRLEQYRNDVFSLAAEEIRSAAAEAASQTDDQRLQVIGRAHLALTPAELAAVGDVDEDEEKRWLARVAQRVSRAVDQHIADVNQRVPGAIPSHVSGGIKKEALSALAL